MAESPRRPPRYPIESVDSALRLLKLVTDRGGVGVSQAGRLLGVAPSTAHRLLAMLEHHDLIAHDPGSKAYVPGPWLSDFALGALTDIDVRGVARPHVEALVERVGETAHLVALQGRDAVFLDCVECTATVRATSRTGQRLPAYCSAGGKALLARLPEERLAELLPGDPLPVLTPHSPRRRGDLLDELAQVRAEGHATNRRESEPDVHAVAAAIVDGRGRARAAVTVAGPPERLKAERLIEIAPDVRATAAAIGRALGDL